LTDDRDRDELGRARNARPRDAAGRPLDRAAGGVARAPDERDLTPDQALAEAERLLTAGQPFAAHDVLEATWKSRRAQGAADTAKWQGLAQVAVGLTHLQRGNPTGAATLLRRGADNVGGSPIADWARELGVAIESDDQSTTQRLLGNRPHLG
jgi:hypothetical protein